MKLAVISHKKCWHSKESPSGYATRGGFPLQIGTLSQLFDETVLVLPVYPEQPEGERPLVGHNLSVVPLPRPTGKGLKRRIKFIGWMVRSARIIWREIKQADAVHTPVPGDIGTVGMILALLARKPLFVRHCGNWLAPVTRAEIFWKWIMGRCAGGRNVMLATGGTLEAPSKNPNVRWIFSTSLSRAELQTCAAPRRSGVSQNPRLILACRQEEDKGAGVVIDSLPLILSRFPGASLDVVGNGSALEKFKSRAGELGVADKVHFHGEVNHGEVIRLLQNADIYAYPTAASEGFPKSVLEALACGLPVVTTRVSVLPLLLSSGCGMLLDERTPEALAEAVRKMLIDESRYYEMSRCAEQTASRYSLEEWRDTIGGWLQEAWKRPLRDEGVAPVALPKSNAPEAAR
jgi:glycosyltransferase involved in cell wall biosynthesis